MNRKLILNWVWGSEVFWCHQNISVIRKSFWIPKYSDYWIANESRLARRERLLMQETLSVSWCFSTPSVSQHGELNAALHVGTSTSIAAEFYLISSSCAFYSHVRRNIGKGSKKYSSGMCRGLLGI